MIQNVENVGEGKDKDKPSSRLPLRPFWGLFHVERG